MFWEYTPVLEDNNWDGNYIKERRRYQKIVQRVFETVESGLGRCVSNVFVMDTEDAYGERVSIGYTHSVATEDECTERARR